MRLSHGVCEFVGAGRRMSPASARTGIRVAVMGLLSLLTKTVTLHEPARPTVDVWNQPVVTWVDHQVNCYYRRLYSDDADGVGVVVTETYAVYLPAGTDVDEDWEVSLDGERYVVVGDVHRQWNPRTSQVEYVMVTVRKRSL